MFTNRSTPTDRAAASTCLACRSTLVLTASRRVHLEQRQVLERGGVEDDLGAVLREDLRQPVGVADVGDHQAPGVEQGPALEAQLQRVEGGLVAVEHDQRVGGEPRRSGGTARCRSIRRRR